MALETIGVQLGRFAPYHAGHEKVTQKITERHGKEKTLIMVGSSNNLTAERTPYTFEQRVAMIRKRWADVKIIGLPDQLKGTRVPDINGADFAAWIDSIKELEERFRANFKFYGGSEVDTYFLQPYFDTEVIVDRESEGAGISATKMREALLSSDFEALRQSMHPDILTMAREFLRQNFRTLFLQHPALMPA